MQPALASNLRRAARTTHSTPEPGVTVTMGEMCRTLRQQAGVSLAQMALLTHRDTSTLSRFERGHSRPRDVDNLVRAYRELLPQTQPRPQRSDRPRVWALAYLALSPFALVPLFLAGPATWDARVARAWILVSLAVIVASVLPTIIRDARRRRHPIPIIARAGYASALLMITTAMALNWGRHISPVLAFEAVAVIAFGLLTVAYDRTERESAPAE